MKCVVIDDEPLAIGILEEYIAKVHFLDLLGSFRNAVKALEYVRLHDVDLIFLDINMPDISGMEFLNSLDDQPLVVFTTAYSEYAARSYDYEAVDYLVKPIEFERFLKAASRALSRFEARRLEEADGEKANAHEEDSILVKSGADYHSLRLSDILLVEAAGNYVTFVTATQKVLSLMTLKNACKKLPADRFIRIHRSFIVAFDKIDVIQRDQVIVRGAAIPIGEAYRQELQNRIDSSR